MKRFLLARHGETHWNREGRIQGWSEISLNERGEHQAEQLGEFLGEEYPDLDAIYASDLSRAVETVETVKATAPFGDLSVQYDRRWRERDLGVYQGYDSDTFFEKFPEFAILDRGQQAAAAVPESGESYLAFRERVLRAWEDITSQGPEDVLVVAHGGVLRTILGSVLDLGMREAIAELDPANAGFAEIEYDSRAGEGRVVHRNRVEHLRRTV